MTAAAEMIGETIAVVEMIGEMIVAAEMIGEMIEEEDVKKKVFIIIDEHLFSCNVFYSFMLK